MITIAIICGVLTAFVYISLVARLSKKALYYVTGYNALVDLIFTILIVGMAAATGTTTGLLVSAFTGLFLTIGLIVLKRYLGYVKLKKVKGTWFKFEPKAYLPTNTLPSSLTFLQKYLPTVDKVYA